MTNRRISVIGLGYVGLPVAVAFGEKFKVIGFDVNKLRIEELQNNIDRTGEVTKEDLINSSVYYTPDSEELKKADFHIVAVPTPIDKTKKPDLTPLTKASETVAASLTKGSIVVYESTVYPGTTEEVCVPILEKGSGLICGKDFTVGYSPERINPGDHEHRFKNIVKVVSGQDEKTTKIVAEVYGAVVEAGVYPVANIKVAEAAKVIENTQRDLNIALINELSLIFEKLGIDTVDVLEAAGTKWNFLPFRPGLVGGHCIGVDPYYLTHKAEQVGYHAKVILSGREINDSMPIHIVKRLVKEIQNSGKEVKDSLITVLGITFKEDVPDIRNTKVVDIIHELSEHGIKTQAFDPIADPAETLREYGISLIEKEALKKSDAVILAVPHKEIINYGWNFLSQSLRENGAGIIYDIKSVIPKNSFRGEIKLIRL
ncbi:MAG: nucleotide sugar dehydrogenase [Nitrospinae bacterium]|nr:nucleotide sugar dehydrogenase [Nitrospinota bacterium]